MCLVKLIARERLHLAGGERAGPVGKLLQVPVQLLGERAGFPAGAYSEGV